MVANILPAYPQPSPPTLGGGMQRSKFNFFRTWSCCITNYMESRMKQHGNKYFTRRHSPLPTLWVGSKCQISTFSEHGHVAYQFKGNHKCSNKVANILRAEPAREKYWYEIHDVLVPILHAM